MYTSVFLSTANGQLAVILEGSTLDLTEMVFAMVTPTLFTSLSYRKWDAENNMQCRKWNAEYKTCYMFDLYAHHFPQL